MAKKATILVIDKEKILVDLLIRTLSSAQLSVAGATTTEEAARLMDTYVPDLIVIDPSIDNGSPALRTRAQELGAKTIVARDAGLDDLIAAIQAELPAGLRIFGDDNRIPILIGDGEDELRNLLADYLQNRGYAVFIAKNGHEAVEQVQKNPELKIALLDIGMPIMGGIEALSKIVAQNPHPAVIIMTAVADREIARQAMRNGAFDFIVKPFDLGAMESSIDACLSYSEYQKQPWWKRLTSG